MLARLLLPCIVLLAALGFSRGVLAQTRLFTDSYQHESCDKAIVKSVGDHFELDHFPDRLVANECKPWPTDKSRMIAAFAYDIDEVYNNSIKAMGFRYVLLVLALLDTQNKKIISSYKTRIQEDTKSSLMIDTARYRLSKTTRAFALRLNNHRYVCVTNGVPVEGLTLFIISGKELRPVLSQTMSRQWRFGAICGEGGDIMKVTADIFIAVEKTSTNGFADLRFLVKSDAKKKPPSMVVKYDDDGKSYDITAWDEAFDVWWRSVLDSMRAEAAQPQAKP